MTIVDLRADPLILIVDGDPNSLHLSHDILTAAGYGNLCLCTSPRDALEAVERLSIDLAICDLATPDIDGHHLLWAMRNAVPKEEFFPMLVVSGDGKPETRTEVMTLGADDFLIKPIDSAEMTLRVGHLLELRALHSSLSSVRDEQTDSKTDESEAAMQRLENLVKAKDIFITSVSHELRTPLAAVLGYASELADGATGLSGSDVSEAARVIAEQATELLANIDDLLVAARSDINAVEALHQSVDMTKELVAVVRGMSAIDRVRIKMPTGELTVDGDRLRVRQVLRNLINNALRHSGGRVVVQLGADGEVGTVTVIDDGPGVPLESRDRLFEPYFHGREDALVTPTLSLGLTVSRFLARLMGGDLKLVRRPAGTAFELSLPMG